MKYVSIDIETTGLNPDKCQIIQFAAVVDDLNIQAPLEDLPKYNSYVIADTYVGEAYALAMNAEIFKKISNYKKENLKVVSCDNLLLNFREWLIVEAEIPFEDEEISKSEKEAFKFFNRFIKVVAAGKNFANFDNLFLRKLKGYGEAIKFHHRILDTSTLYFDPKLDREYLPSTEECMRRAEIEGKVAHTALEDALTVVKLLRKKFPIGA